MKSYNVVKDVKLVSWYPTLPDRPRLDKLLEKIIIKKEVKDLQQE